MKKDILCIHYYYPPIRSGGVLRNYYFSKAFAKHFSKVHIITTSNVDVMEKEPLDIPENVVIYKASTRDFRSFTTNSNHRSEQLKRSFLVERLIKLKKTLPFHFMIGEGGQRYIRSAIGLASNIIQEHPISHIYSSFMPYADHKIASRIAQHHKELHWIADFRDLQVEPIYNNIYFPEWNKRQERKLLKPAKTVVTVSKGLASSMKHLEREVLAVPRGIELWAKAPPKQEKFTIVYTGNLFQHYRDGAFFVNHFCDWVRALDLEEKVQFVYAGRDSSAWKTWFEDQDALAIFKDEGFISRNRARKWQGEAHALLLLSSSSKEHKGVLTGKLFEYLETRNPILNCINGVQDEEFEALFDELEAGYIFYPEDGENIKHILTTLYDAYRNKEPFVLSDTALKSRQAITWDARVKTILDASEV